LVDTGSAPEAEEVLRAFATSVPALGLEVNKPKTTIW